MLPKNQDTLEKFLKTCPRHIKSCINKSFTIDFGTLTRLNDHGETNVKSMFQQWLAFDNIEISRDSSSIFVSARLRHPKINTPVMQRIIANRGIINKILFAVIEKVCQQEYHHLDKNEVIIIHYRTLISFDVSLKSNVSARVIVYKET